MAEVLGELQTRILQLICERNWKEPIIANEIAVILGKGHSTAAASVDSLINKKLLSVLQEPADRRKKYLVLSDKGACYALVYCGITIDTLRKNHEDRKFLFFPLDKLQTCVKSKEKMDAITNDFCQFLLRCDLFDQNGNMPMMVEKSRDFVYFIPDPFVTAILYELVKRILLFQYEKYGEGHVDREATIEYLKQLSKGPARYTENLLRKVANLREEQVRDDKAFSMWGISLNDLKSDG